MFDWLTRRRRLSIPDALWREAVDAVRLLDAYDEPARARLRELVAGFLARKALTPARGLVLDDHMRLVVAIQSCLPVLHLGLGWLDGWHEIILYPGQFRVRRRHEDSDTQVVTEWDDELAGESWSHGPLILSWADVAQDLAEPFDGFNVVIHEIAHKLDMLDGDSDGVPPIRGLEPLRAWKRALAEGHAALAAAVDAGQETVMDPYAAEAPDEFFAVASEYYFSAPDVLVAHYPAVHAGLAGFYGPVPMPAF